jgi:YtoQ family protein
MELTVYLSGEIHSNWREEIIRETEKRGLPVEFLTPVTDHGASDDVGDNILGAEKDPFWKDHKSAKINMIRISTGLERADLVVIKFGEKYRQWNAAFDAGYAAALGKPYVVIHPDEFRHALKEVDSRAMAVAKESLEVVSILEYVVKEYF